MGILDLFKRSKGKPQRRNYAAAGKGRLFGDFIGSNRSADSEIRWALRDIRNRSRDLERNNEYFRRYLQLLRVNVVGENGFNLQVKGRNPDNSIDRAGNNIIEGAWKEFCRMGGPTIDGRMSMVDLCNHIISGMARDGEVFLRIVKGNYLRHGIALNIIEPDRVDEEKNELAANGNQIRMGVELDKDTKRPVAYWVTSVHKGDYDYMMPRSELKYTRVPADEMMHIYRMERAGQTRGVPWSTAAISALKMLHGYREAELVAARTAASKMGFFTSPAGDGFMGDGFEGEHGSGSPIFEASAGTFAQLPAGVSFQAFDPSHPTSAYADFEKSIIRGIAGGLGVSYTSLANDLEGTSYSSIRQGALEERDFYKTLHRFMIDHFLDPMYRTWLKHVMDFGYIPISGDNKFFKFTQDVTWRGRGFQWVDPLKEINAAVVGLQNGILSHSDIAANYGRDAEDTFAQINRDQDLAEEYGLKMAYQPFGDKQPVPAETDDAVQTD
jgi:lambda family phage portal protein